MNYARVTWTVGIAGSALFAMLVSGCTSPPQWRRARSEPRAPLGSLGQAKPPPIRQAAHFASSSVAEGATSSPMQLFSNAGELTDAALIEAVVARNPRLEQMRSAAAAAASRYPQVTSLDDPSVTISTAPGSIGSANADFAARVEISQKLPYPGKRSLRGAVVGAEASAAEADVDETRLDLVEAAVSALADYYLVLKTRAVVTENLDLLKEFRKAADARYRVGQGPQQDLLQADVEIARMEERLVALRRGHQVAISRLNTLMHLPPDHPLPPPAELRTGASIPDTAKLHEWAISNRPDLKAVSARLSADEAGLALTVKEYSPDVEVMTAYDGFWQDAGGRPLQWQIGARVNLPIRLARRAGAVAEAHAKVAQRRAELARLTDRVNFEVREAVEQLRESEAVVQLYEERVLKAADANVKEAQAGYAATKVPFLNLVDAQRSRVMLKERFYEAVAETSRRRATLTKVIGGTPPGSPAGMIPRLP